MLFSFIFYTLIHKKPKIRKHQTMLSGGYAKQKCKHYENYFFFLIMVFFL